MKNYQIAASLLSADFARLGEDAQAVIDAGADILHFDAMDNHYVPNLTIGPVVCSALRKFGIIAPISVHIMAKPVDSLIIDFAKAGATEIIFHPESSSNIDKSLDLILKYECTAGLALNPETSIDCLYKYLEKIKTILVMSVHPGFSGQKFISSTLQKIAQIKNDANISHKNSIRIAVDGGVNLDNIGDIAGHGANVFVSGSTIFKNPPYSQIISKMREKVRGC